MKQIAALILMLSAGLIYAEDLPTQHTVQPKDTLWDLAQFYYHDPFKWGVIAQANPPPMVKDPHWIYPKQIIKIPMIEMVPQPPQSPAAEPTAEPSPAPTPEAAPQLAPEPEQLRPEPSPGLPNEGVSDIFPAGLVGVPPSFERFKAPSGWQPDGSILEDRQDGESLLSQGDIVRIRINDNVEVQRGDRFVVLRKSAPTDVDIDQQAEYLAKIGLVEIQGRISKGVYRASILRSDDAIQFNDMIERRQ